MIIRKLEKSDECQAKELWKSCFGDSDAFIDAYFKNKVDYNHSLGMFIGDELVCDLFMLDVDFVYNGKSYKSGFLAGCATKKEYRHRGYMKTLLMRQLEIMKNMRLDSSCAVELLRNEQLLLAQIVYLETILYHTHSGVGSRGSSIVLASDGVKIHSGLDWLMVAENTDFRNKILTSQLVDGELELQWEKCRPVPETDDWFENIWHDYRKGIIYE